MCQHYWCMYDVNHDAGWVYALRPIDGPGYVCVTRSAGEHVVVFSDGAAAMDWRDRQGLRLDGCAAHETGFLDALHEGRMEFEG